ncbi:MAG: HEAT repeat domain-containing protein [Ktedonobacterales bacterium]|nr:HEAT repeat domain-containing protein [Ktedonobacterales bacterium]
MADALPWEEWLQTLASADPASHVRSAAAGALGQLGDPRATQPLLAAFSADAENRGLIAGALSQIGDRSVIPAMLAALGHGDSDVRDNAAYVLGTLGGPEVLDPLLHALKDVAPEVRYTAAEALGTLGDVRALPALQAVAEQDSGKSWSDFHGAPPGQSVAFTAQRAIEELLAQ